MPEPSQNLDKFIPAPYKKRQYYTRSQLERHNTANDAWLALFHDIYDVTQLIQSNRNKVEVEPLITAAGTDVTHWFEDKTKQPRTKIDEKTGNVLFSCPAFIHLDSLRNDPLFIPWWKNQSLLAGKLTRKSQRIRIINSLSQIENELQVPSQESINQILARYEEINAHATSYTWKRKGTPLKMDLTLSDNGIIDQTELYGDLEVPPEQQYIPAIHLHFNDDLTIQ